MNTRPENPTTAQPGTPASEMVEIEVKVREASKRRGDPPQVTEVATGVLRMIAENLEQMTPFQVQKVLRIVRQINVGDYFDFNFWRNLGLALDYQFKEQLAFIQRRLEGNYQTDPYGFDQEIFDRVQPFFRFMYYIWWRVETDGILHVPLEGRGLLVSNHSGVIPWDGAMIATAIHQAHPSRRIVRNLYLHWFSTLPFVGTTMTSLGNVPGIPENATRLLEEDELVCTFPEGVKGIGKLFKHRYHLSRFGRGGFIQIALRTGAPIIPVAVVGAEEIYPMLANVEPLARLLGMPYFPITPTFPWLGPFGAVPLPTHWHITFCPPIPTESYGPEGADDPLVVFKLSEQVRETIQETVDAQLARRKSLFW